MTVENLALKDDGKNVAARHAAIARRSVQDADVIRQRQTLEKDSFMAFGHDANGNDPVPESTFLTFTD